MLAGGVHLRGGAAGHVVIGFDVAVVIHPAEVGVNEAAAIRGAHTVGIEIAVAAVRILPALPVGHEGVLRQTDGGQPAGCVHLHGNAREEQSTEQEKRRQKECGYSRKPDIPAAQGYVLHENHLSFSKILYVRCPVFPR